LGGEGREEGGGEGVGAPFNVLPQGATDLVAPLIDVEEYRDLKSRSGITQSHFR